MAQNEQLTNTEFYTNKDPENQDALDQGDGLNGGSESGSNFWIYALVGVLLIGGIIVLIVCLSGKKSKATTKAYKFDVPAEGDLKPTDTQKFVKELHDYAEENKKAGAALKKKLEDAAKLIPTKPEEAQTEINKLYDDSEQLGKDIFALIEQATPYAERIDKEEISGVKSPKETVENYLKAGREGAMAGKAELETTRSIEKAIAARKDPKKPTAEEQKTEADLEAKLKAEVEQGLIKKKAVEDAEAELKKLLPPAEKPADPKPANN